MPTTLNNEETFKAQLVALIPRLRAFARSLCGDSTEGDDLAQGALTKAWAARDRFEPGTNLKAWTFMILRNLFYTDKRRSWHNCALDPEVAERTLVSPADATKTLELDELGRAMSMLCDEQREALIMIGAAGLSYGEASQIIGVAVGTVKSRVSRARDHLALIYAEGLIPQDGRPAHAVMDSLLLQIETCLAGKRVAA